MEGTAPTPSPQPTPIPLENYAVAPKRWRVLWKWSLVAAALLFGYVLWQCGSGMIAGSRLSDAAVRNFHSQLDAGDYEGILRNSDLSFQNSDSHDDLVKFLAAVHSKLGPSQGAARTNIFVTTGTSGTFIRTVYKGYFEEGEAIENFTWRNTGSALKLVGYHIESKALITR